MYICNNAKDAKVITSYLDRMNSSSKPTVLFHLNDEYGGGHPEHRPCIEIYHRFKLVLREYQYHGQSPATTVVQIPLSYNQLLRFREDNRQHFHSLNTAEWSWRRNVSQREYRWAFVGAIWSDNKGHKMRQKAVG